MNYDIDIFAPAKQTSAHRALCDLMHLIRIVDQITGTAIHTYFLEDESALPKDKTKEICDMAHLILHEATELLPLAFKLAGIRYPKEIEGSGRALRGYANLIEEMYKLDEEVFRELHTLTPNAL